MAMSAFVRAVRFAEEFVALSALAVRGLESAKRIRERALARRGEDSMSNQMKYRTLALLGLVSLMGSSVARADDCDTPMAESCACRSQVASAPAKHQPTKTAKASSARVEKKSELIAHRSR